MTDQSEYLIEFEYYWLLFPEQWLSEDAQALARETWITKAIVLANSFAQAEERAYKVGEELVQTTNIDGSEVKTRYTIKCISQYENPNDMTHIK